MSRRTRVIAGRASVAVRRLVATLVGPTATELMLVAAEARLGDRASLVGKRVLITGSTRGIGRALAAGFARRGARVVVHGRSEATVREAASAIAQSQPSHPCAAAIAADLSIAGEGRALVQRALAEIGGLDLVINNAAIHPPTRKPIWTTSSEEMAEVLKVNVLAPFDVSVAAIASMLARGVAGRVINISTGAANPVNVSPVGVASYGISKFALEGLSSYLAAEVRGIAITTLRPAAIDTDMVAPLFPRDERWLMLPPESMVPVVVYLATAPGVQVHGRVFEQLELLRELSMGPDAGSLGVAPRNLQSAPAA
jgi:NAD(P)-dependent dehydrogenase (short-subunit alcohol dehydrogenase family)